MPAYVTKSRLRTAAASGRFVAEAAVRKAERQSPEGSTFLSHSSKDRDLLAGVIAILERHGARVYIDKKDDELPPYTSRETANILRARVRQYAKFILFTTKASKDSRWMPWELGLADGYKGQGNTAIMPGVDQASEKSWTEQEYLGVYNRIVYGGHANYAEDVFMVWNQDTNKATELRDWLSR